MAQSSRPRCLYNAVEATLTRLAGLTSSMVVRTRLPPLLAVEEPMQHPVMPGAEDCDALVAGERVTALGERLDVMDMQGTPALTSQVCEGALSVVCEDVRAVVAPGLLVVQGGHE